MRIRNLRRMIVVALVACVVLAAAGWGYFHWRIQSELVRCCVMAQAAHPNPADNVAALTAFVQSPAQTLPDRNNAVWALGQCRDGRALEVLRRHYTGQPCNHDCDLCQRELDKAIRLCSGQTPNFLCIRTP